MATIDTATVIVFSTKTQRLGSRLLVKGQVVSAATGIPAPAASRLARYCSSPGFEIVSSLGSYTEENKAADWVADYNHLPEWVAAEGSDAVAEIVTLDALEDAGLVLDYFEVRDAIELSIHN